MNERVEADDTSGELEQVNHDLARLFDQPPARVWAGAAHALADPLVICGLLGGKDVGKSTLINALAGTRVSADEAEVGPGTARPIAYVHADVIAIVRARFAPPRCCGVELDFAVHEVELLRHVVLIDLPDFDSEFVEHRRIVESVAPLLDRVIWVVTPRKIGDREWVALVRNVIKDTQNVHCVLNKLDELLIDDESWAAPRRAGGPAGNGDGYPRADAQARADKLWRSFHDWVATAGGLTPQSAAPLPGDHQFLVAAAYADADALTARVAHAWDDPHWHQHAGDRAIVQRISEYAAEEIRRLRERVLSPVTRPDADAIKQANQRREVAAHVHRLRAHYRVDEWRELIDRACDPSHHLANLSEALEPEYLSELARNLARRRQPDQVLAEELMAARVERWPILRAAYWPLSWFVVRIGRGLAHANVEAGRPQGDPLEVRGRSLLDRLRLLDARSRDDHARVIERFRLAKRLPRPEDLDAQLRHMCHTLVDDVDRELLNGLRSADRRPALWRRGLLWFALFWFPLIQPVTEAALSARAGGSGWAAAWGVVRALGAGRLLAGLGVDAAICVVALAAMYAGCIRDVRRVRGAALGHLPHGHPALEADPAVESACRGLVERIVTSHSAPFAGVRRELQACIDRLNRLDNSGPA